MFFEVILSMNTQQNRPISGLWRFFGSVKLTLVILILLALVSVWGTLIPQREEAVEFARRLGPGLSRFLESLHLFDLYHSWWFQLLVGLLAVNLVVCSLDRWPGVWRRFRAQPRPDRTRPFDDLPPEQGLDLPIPLAEAVPKVSSILEQRLGKVSRKTGQGEVFFAARKGRYTLFGVYLIHLSVLIILLGAIIGSLGGFEAYVNIVEGRSTDTVLTRGTMKPLRLDFSVRCDRFKVEFYPSGAPKEYLSEVTFLEHGKAVAKGNIRVNHPLTFQGVTFYQSSYGQVAGETAHLRVIRKASPLLETPLEAHLNRPLKLPGDPEAMLRVVDLRGDVMGMGPAALISIVPGKGEEEVRFWIFQNPQKAMQKLPEPMRLSPRFNASAFAPYTFLLDKVDTRFYTGLQVSRDPGVPVVWVGFFVMVVGLFVSFFTSHRHFWVRIVEHGKGCRIQVAGSSTKNPVGLKRELRDLVLSLRKEL